LPFGGGSGAGVSITPVAFLVVQDNSVKLLPTNHTSAIDKLLDYVPDLLEKTNEMMNKCMNNSKKCTQKLVDEIKKNQKKYDEIKRPKENIELNENTPESDGEIFGNDEYDI
jgi:uncharacterized spore protein YtfJ